MIGLYGPRNTVRKHLDPMLTPRACPRAGRAHSHPFFGGGGRLRRMGSRQSTKIDQNRPKSKIVDFRKSSIFEKHDFWFSSVSDCVRVCTCACRGVHTCGGAGGSGWRRGGGAGGTGGTGGAMPRSRKSKIVFFEKHEKTRFSKNTIFGFRRFWPVARCVRAPASVCRCAEGPGRVVGGVGEGWRGWGGWGGAAQSRKSSKSKIVEIEKTRFSKIVDFQKKIEKVEKVKMRVSPSEA